jgi:transposase
LLWIGGDTSTDVNSYPLDRERDSPRGYAPEGERCQALRPGTRRDRLSIMAALNQNQLVAPFVYRGTCVAKVVEAWLEHSFLPTIFPGKGIIMDNAPFHNSKRICQLVEAAGCRILFLPPYSPDFNPIEHWWYKVKTAIRSALQSFDHLLDIAVSFAFETL